MTSTYRHYRAPRGDGEVLCDPGWQELPAVWRRNRSAIVASQACLAGRSLRAWRTQARADVLEIAARYSGAYRSHLPIRTDAGDPPPPIVLAGHQPQMFHPGVWCKNFALDSLARQTGAVPVNLIVDNDTFRSPTIQVPAGSIDDPHGESLPFDRAADALPYEERPIVDRGLAASFAERVRATIGPFVPDPLVGPYWPLVMEAAKVSDRWGECLAQARHRLEESWGLSTLEVPLSQVCDRMPFRWFACDLLARLTDFVRSHNAALADYRAAHRLRSKAHPVPDLEIDGEWQEAPFWVWSRESPRRRRLWARRIGREMELSDRGHWAQRIPFEEPSTQALQAFDDWTRQGWKLRPRALTTTLYARLLLSDLFIHGIGGGKYDQVTERLAQSFYGIALPTAAVITGTWRLPIARPASHGEELARIDDALRRLHFDPGYFLAQAPVGERNPAIEGWLAERQKYVATDPSLDPIARHRALLRVRAALSPAVEPMREKLAARRVALARQERIESLLSSREHSFVLFPQQFFHNHLLAFFGEKP